MVGVTTVTSYIIIQIKVVYCYMMTENIENGCVHPQLE